MEASKSSPKRPEGPRRPPQETRGIPTAPAKVGKPAQDPPKDKRDPHGPTAAPSRLMVHHKHLPPKSRGIPKRHGRPPKTSYKLPEERGDPRICPTAAPQAQRDLPQSKMGFPKIGATPDDPSLPPKSSEGSPQPPPPKPERPPRHAKSAEGTPQTPRACPATPERPKGPPETLRSPPKHRGEPRIPPKKRRGDPPDPRQETLESPQPLPGGGGGSPRKQRVPKRGGRCP